MIVMITGGLGSFKTCLLTRYSVLSFVGGKLLISNYHLTRLPYQKLDIADLYLNKPDLDKMAILGDELYTHMDCRMSISKRNRLESYFIAQTRKIDTDIIFTTQFSSFMDKRLVGFVDVWIEMTNIWLFNKKTGIRYKHPHKAIMSIMDYRDPKNIINKVMVFDGRKYFDEYNTKERIYPPDDIDEVEKRIKKGNRNRKEKS